MHLLYLCPECLSPRTQRGPEQGSCTFCTSAQNAFLHTPRYSQVHCSLAAAQAPLLRGLPPPLPLLPCSGPGSFTAGVSVHTGLCVGLSSLLERKTPGSTRSDCSPASPGTAPGTWRVLHSSLSLSLSPDWAPPVISGVDGVGCSSSLLLRRGGNVSDDALGSPVRMCEQGVGPEAVGTPSGPAASRLLFSPRPAFSVLRPPPAVSPQEGGEDACSSGEVQVQGKR